MKTIEVVAAIIRKGDKIFATQRGYGEWKDYWEYPGGKVEPGESPEQALVREIREELDTEIHVDKFLCTVEWDYPKFHLTMHCFMCSLLTEALHLNEHEDARWLSAANLGSVNWLPADDKLLPLIRQELSAKSVIFTKNINMKPIQTEKAPAAIGPYSQAIDSGAGLVFVSGQLPINPATGAFPEGGVKEQTFQSLTNASAILEAAGLSLKNVVKTTVFLADMGDFAAMNEVYAQFFQVPFPARSAVAVKTLPKGALVEIECIAAK